MTRNPYDPVSMWGNYLDLLLAEESESNHHIEKLKYYVCGEHACLVKWTLLRINECLLCEILEINGKKIEGLSKYIYIEPRLLPDSQKQLLLDLLEKTGIIGKIGEISESAYKNLSGMNDLLKCLK